MKASAGEKDRGDDDGPDPAIGDEAEDVFEGEADCGGNGGDDKDREDAERLAEAWPEARAIEREVEAADEPAEKHDGVGEAPPDGVGVADCGVERQRRREHPQVRKGEHEAAPSGDAVEKCLIHPRGPPDARTRARITPSGARREARRIDWKCLM